MIDPILLGSAIASARRARGFTQHELGQMTGLTVNYLSLLEHGHRSTSLDSLTAIAGACGTHPIVLLARAALPDRQSDAVNDIIRKIRDAAEQAGHTRPPKTPAELRTAETPEAGPTPRVADWIPGFNHP